MEVLQFLLRVLISENRGIQICCEVHLPTIEYIADHDKNPIKIKQTNLENCLYVGKNG